MGQIVFLKVLLMSTMCPQLQYVLNPGQCLWKRDKEDVEIGDENYWEHDTISVMTDCQDWDCPAWERNEFRKIWQDYMRYRMPYEKMHIFFFTLFLSFVLIPE